MASLFEHIRSSRLPGGGPPAATTPSVGPLPDEPADDPAPYGGPRIRWAAGARDGVAVFHVTRKPPGIRQIAPIVDALMGYARQPGEAERSALESLVVRVVGDEPFVPFVGPVLDRLERVLDDEQSLARQALPEALRRLARETEQRDCMKLALSLLGAFGGPEDRELLETAGLHDEFTLYAIDSLDAIFSDPIDSWLAFARALSGWGKIHAVHALIEKLPDAGGRRDEIAGFLLRSGCENGVQHGYLALEVATAAALHEALGAAPHDPALLLGAGVILSSLAEDAAQGGPGGEMADYPQGALAAARYVRAVAEPGSPVAERLDAFLAVATLRQFVEETVASDPARWAELGWDEATREEIRGKAEAFLRPDRWRDAALAVLQNGDIADRWKARGVCRVLGVPMATELEFVVGADPTDVGAWCDLADQADREGMERATRIAPQLLRLDRLFAVGPDTSLGFGPDFPRFEICDALARGLARFPGSGGGFLRLLLGSPSVRNRHSALRAYDGWPQLGPDDRAAIAVVAAGDPDGRVREVAQRLKLEKG